MVMAEEERCLRYHDHPFHRAHHGDVCLCHLSWHWKRPRPGSQHDESALLHVRHHDCAVAVERRSRWPLYVDARCPAEGLIQPLVAYVKSSRR